MQDQLEQIRGDYQANISQATSLKELNDIFLSLFGKKGILTLLPKQFPQLTQDELKRIGPLFNLVKEELEQAISKRRQQVKEESYKKLLLEKLQLDTPGVQIKKRTGHLHPITKFEQEIADLFSKLGFQQFDAPHIDTDFNNFEVLNIPQQHPARDLWDTIYIDSKGIEVQPGKLLLRTHTSNAQIGMLKKYPPPIRLINMGRCFRYEAVDARHDHTFEQFEVVVVDKNISMANLQYLSEVFLKSVFGPKIRTRLRPKYFPFVEPGAGVDGLCIFCQGKGCNFCGGVGWLELAGAGLIHPQVLKNGGVDPKKYSGLAWGFGPERLIMLKYGIEDIRLFKNGDLKFLERF